MKKILTVKDIQDEIELRKFQLSTYADFVAPSEMLEGCPTPEQLRSELRDLYQHLSDLKSD